MNLLVVDQFGEIGGAQKCLLDLLEGWHDGGVLMAAVPEGDLARALRSLAIPVFCLRSGPYRNGGKTAADALRFCADAAHQFSQLRGMIDKHAIDVVYVNGPRVLPGATLAARGHCRVVFHAHNHLANWYDRVVVSAALARGGVRAIACCRHVADSVGAAATVIENGVPDAGFRPRRYPPPGPWRIGVVGRISPEKGQLALIGALRLLIEEGHRIDVEIAGAAQFAPAGYEAEVRRAATGLPVRFTGWSDDISAVFERLDLLAVPSAAEPGLPRVVLEAFSAGLPVVAAPTGGIPEAVRDGETGYLARDNSALALASRLRSAMAGDPSDLTRVALRARSEWHKRWRVERWRREVESVIRSAQAQAETVQQRRRQRGRVMSKA